MFSLMKAWKPISELLIILTHRYVESEDKDFGKLFTDFISPSK